jgi:hypothetical protein
MSEQKSLFDQIGDAMESAKEKAQEIAKTVEVAAGEASLEARKTSPT